MNNKEYGSIQGANANVAAKNTQMEKFHASQGHGFAAEQANNLIDTMEGKSASVVGGDNAKNGADRLVNGSYVQVKYCRTASESVGAAFKNGQYRYLSNDGTPMKLEVPKDQYEAALEVMRDRIKKGEVPGVTDPAQAEDLVAQGHVTYQQACNIAKAGTVESLAFDAVNGAVYAVNAFGISATIAFALSYWKGEDVSVAIENAVVTGLQVGGTAFLTSVAVGQINRMGFNKALTPAFEELVKLMGKKNAEILAEALRGSADLAGEEAMKDVAKLLKCNAITSAVTMIVLSAQDVKYAVQGKISGKQLFKNVATTAGGITGAGGGSILGTTVGAAVGGAVAGPAGAATGAKVGNKAGMLVGGVVGGAGTNKVVGCFVEDDAVELVSIIERETEKLAAEYLLSREEIGIVIDEIKGVLAKEKFLEMHASPSPTEYADNLIMETINRVICFRPTITNQLLPSGNQMLTGVIRAWEHYANGTGIFVKGKAGPDAVKLGGSLTGKEYSEKASKKALYVAKQSNASQMSKELNLLSAKRMEAETSQKLRETEEGIANSKQYLDNVLSTGGLA